MYITLTKPIVLIGLMGSGKTTVGFRLSRKIGCAFFDSDHMVEEMAGMSVSDIFETKGEPYFRDLEYQLIKQDLKMEPHVLATGGGAFMQRNIRDVIKEYAISVWLKADLDVLVERVSRKKTRPLLERGDKRRIMEQLMEARYPVYSEADIVIESGDGPHEAVVDSVLRALQEHGA